MRKKINIRQVQNNDLFQFFEWIEDEMLEYYFLPSKYLSQRELEEEFKRLFKDTILLIIETVEGDSIGYSYIKNLNKKDLHAEFRIAICKKEYQIQDDYWVTTCDILFNYFFNMINLHKVYTVVYEFEQKYGEILDKICKREGVLAEDFFRNGRYYDKYIYSISKEEYQGWEKNYGTKR